MCLSPGLFREAVILQVALDTGLSKDVSSSQFLVGTMHSRVSGLQHPDKIKVHFLTFGSTQ